MENFSFKCLAVFMVAMALSLVVAVALPSWNGDQVAAFLAVWAVAVWIGMAFVYPDKKATWLDKPVGKAAQRTSLAVAGVSVAYFIGYFICRAFGWNMSMLWVIVLGLAVATFVGALFLFGILLRGKDNQPLVQFIKYAAYSSVALAGVGTANFAMHI